MVDAAATPEVKTTAAGKLDTIIDRALGFDADTRIETGMVVRNFRPDASEGTIDLVIKNERFAKESPTVVNGYANAALHALNGVYSLRDNAILLSPAEYLQQGASEITALQAVAEKAGIKMEGVDLSKTVAVRHDISENQKQDHAATVIDGPNLTSIRLQIPTNPKNLEGAENLAEKVAKDIESRLPEIKAGMIARVKEKKYRELTPEQEKHWQDHEFKVTTQQQSGNWTSVFIEIRSPEQVKLREHPEEKSALSPEQLKNTNLLMQVENADCRAKLASRAALFCGPDLRKPASYYSDVAGVMDVKNALGKMLHHLTQKNPDPTLKRRADALMKENFLISREEWNLPREQQSIRKQPVSALVKPGTDELRIRMRVPAAQRDAILKSIAEMDAEKVVAQAAETPSTEPAAAAAGAVVACAPGEVAVAGAGAAVDAAGHAVAGAGGACIDPASKEITAGSAAGSISTPELDAAIAAAIEKQPEMPAVEPKDEQEVVGTLGGTPITNRDIKTFLERVGGRHDARRGAAKPDASLAI